MVNNIALRNSLQTGASFRAALAAERNQVLAEWEHSELPFDLVVEAVQPERVMGRHPLFQAMYFYSEPPAPARYMWQLTYPLEPTACAEPTYPRTTVASTDRSRLVISGDGSTRAMITIGPCSL